MRKGGIVLSLCLAAALLPGVAKAKDCVRAVRSMSDFTIQGDAWTWWQHSEGTYEHDVRPQAGSVLVFKRTGQLGRGHVSLVSGVIDNRTIEVDHTWLRSGQIRRGMTVIDVSPNNDWSEVRVWNEPTDQLGTRTYPTYGFVLPSGAEPSKDSVLASNAKSGDDSSVRPSRRHGRTHGSTQVASAKHAPSAKGKPVSLASAVSRAGVHQHEDAKKAAAAKARHGATQLAAKPQHKPVQTASKPHKPATVQTASLKSKPHRQVASK